MKQIFKQEACDPKQPKVGYIFKGGCNYTGTETEDDSSLLYKNYLKGNESRKKTRDFLARTLLFIFRRNSLSRFKGVVQRRSSILHMAV